jgi:hypothetical protein
MTRRKEARKHCRTPVVDHQKAANDAHPLWRVINNMAVLLAASLPRKLTN